MMVKNYRLLNIITGWVAFAVAAVTYLLTIEPTISFWDCGEFTTTAFNLQVGHPPGNPFFMIVGRFFTLFVHPVYAGMMVNAMSALASAFTVLFLFWTITYLAKKALPTTALGGSTSGTPDNALTTGQAVAILGSGLVGSLAYTFTDTFWFSAVESEVYALSSLFTAIVFWAILRWESVADRPHANKWMVFIAYMIGLSIGVHMLNLLAIPAIVLVWYFKNYKATVKGVVAALAVSVVLLATIMYVMIPGIIVVASWFELLFINGLGMPFKTGVIIYFIILAGLMITGIWYTHKKKKTAWNTILLSTAVIIAGYSSFSIIVIRASANTPMNQNSPDNVFALLSYLNREQYGNNPLLHGQQFNTPMIDQVDGKPYFIQRDGRYVIIRHGIDPVYDPQFTVLFPRMWSSDKGHIDEYKAWSRFKGRPVKTIDGDGNPQTIYKPTFTENMRFFMRYHIGHMYVRYFMWNFVGRQNDSQGHGDIINGNWLSGINFIDSPRLGDQRSLPESLRNNKARNTFYMFPLLLGLLGAVFHYKKNQKGFWVVTMLFIMTGLAIVVYLNQYPNQPRERDYAYAGSFYAFAIWIGFGIMAATEGLRRFRRYIPETAAGIAVTTLGIILVPVIMAAENWDDHDRSNRYTARDMGANFLETCAENGVIFCNGDNETFPLWYNQEVEGRRLDLRVCNLSYLQTDWYVDQMKRKVHDSEPLPISFTHDQYVQGNRDIVYLINDPRITGPVELSKALDFLRSDDPKTKLPQYGNVQFLPSKKFFMKVDKEAVIRNKVVPEHLYDQIVDTMYFDFSNKNYLVKDEWVLLDMIAHANWERPFYFASTMMREKFLGMMDYFQLEGLAYRLVPILTPSDKSRGAYGRVYIERLYDNMLNRFAWGNMYDPDVYIDETNRRMMFTVRSTLNRLAESLIEESQNDSAVAVLNRNLELVPAHAVPYDYLSQITARHYFAAGATEKGLQLQDNIFRIHAEQLQYYLSLPERFLASIEMEVQRLLYYMHDMATVALEFGQDDQAVEINETLDRIMQVYGSK